MPPEEEKSIATELAVLTNEVKNLADRFEKVEKEVYDFRGILGDHSGFIKFFGEKLEQEEKFRKECLEKQDKDLGRRWAIGLATYSSLFAAFLFSLRGLIEAVVKHLCRV